MHFHKLVGRATGTTQQKARVVDRRGPLLHITSNLRHRKSRTLLPGGDVTKRNRVARKHLVPLNEAITVLFEDRCPLRHVCTLQEKRDRSVRGQTAAVQRKRRVADLFSPRPEQDSFHRRSALIVPQRRRQAHARSNQLRVVRIERSVTREQPMHEARVHIDDRLGALDGSLERPELGRRVTTPSRSSDAIGSAVHISLPSLGEPNVGVVSEAVARRTITNRIGHLCPTSSANGFHAHPSSVHDSAAARSGASGGRPDRFY